MASASPRPRPAGVAGCARAAGVEVLDLWQPLVTMARDAPADFRGLYFHPGPQQQWWGHMTPAGNAFVAQQIAERMRSMKRAAVSAD